MHILFIYLLNREDGNIVNYLKFLSLPVNMKSNFFDRLFHSLDRPLHMHKLNKGKKARESKVVQAFVNNNVTYSLSCIQCPTMCLI